MRAASGSTKKIRQEVAQREVAALREAWPVPHPCTAAQTPEQEM
jgi:hypothetical protein